MTGRSSSAIAVLIAAACSGPAPAGPGPLRALVTISDDSGRSKCSGTILRSRDGPADVVLTSAHCVSTGQTRDARTPRRTHRIERAVTHPLFRARDGSPAYDLALLHVPTLAADDSVEGLAIASNVHDTELFVAQGGATPAQPVSVDVAGRTAVSWTIAPNDAVCRGSSGAPLLTRDRAGAWAIAGVISRGPARCDGPFGAARGGDAIDALLEQLSGNAARHGHAESCRECQAAVSLEDGPCSSVAKRCAAEPSCAAFRDAVEREIVASDLERWLEQSTRAQAQWTCLCHTRCRDACRAACASTPAR